MTQANLSIDGERSCLWVLFTIADIEHGQGEQLHEKQDQVATDKDNPFEVLFEDIVTVEDETTQLKIDQEQEEEMLNEDNSDGQHERTFVLCSESEEDELSLESIHLKSKKKICCYLVITY